MLRKYPKTQTDTWTWAASNTGIQQNLLKEGVITQIDFQIDITPSATMESANLPGGVWRIIENLKVEGGGGKNYLSAVGTQMGRILHALNAYDYPGLPFVGERDITTPHNTFISVIFRFHCGSRPYDMYGRYNPYDLSAFIPAHKESSLKATWATTANNVMDGVVTISSATMYATLYVVNGTEGEIRKEMARQGIGRPMAPVSSSETYTHTGNKSNLSQQFDVPAGAFLRRIVILAQDATTVPLGADDEITRVGIFLAQDNAWTVDVSWASLVYGGMPIDTFVTDDEGGGTAITGGMPHAGVGVLDLRPMWHPDYGMDLGEKKSSDVKLGVTIENYLSGDDSYYFYDQVEPIKGSIL